MHLHMQLLLFDVQRVGFGSMRASIERTGTEQQFGSSHTKPAQDTAFAPSTVFISINNMYLQTHLEEYICKQCRCELLQPGEKFLVRGINLPLIMLVCRRMNCTRLPNPQTYQCD